MKQDGQFLLFSDKAEFVIWLASVDPVRKITRIQNHHMWKPDYSGFTGDNHFKLLKAIKEYYVGQGFQDIPQNLTTFPDGSIAVCRPFKVIPGGIKGANTGALCVENVGNFDSGHDFMTPAQKETIVFLNATLCNRFNLIPSTDTILYHFWFDLKTGERLNGKGCTKTCPGTAFFGGNSVEACKQNFIPLIISKMAELKTGKKKKSPEEITVDSIIEDEVSTARQYWFDVLAGKRQASPSTIKKIIDTYHSKLKGAKHEKS